MGRLIEPPSAGTSTVAGLVVGLVLAVSMVTPAAASIDPDQVVTAEACGECHATAFASWQQTEHATGFRTMHRTEAAAAIAERMGLRLIKRDSLCLDCHYTPIPRDDQLRATSGVSCESCHGAGRDWINVHSDYGGKDLNRTTEDPAHRAQRIAASRRAGMRRPSDVYDLVSSCFACHTVPNEDLVNVGRHSLGSSDFELAAWSDRIRHNFLLSFLDGDGTENAARTPSRNRILYVVGRALALEHALRGTARATEEGVFLKSMQRRARNAISELQAIAAMATLPEVSAMVDAVRGTRIGLGQGRALEQAADRVAAQAKAFLRTHDGTRLASLDGLVDGTANLDAIAFEPVEGRDPDGGAGGTEVAGADDAEDRTGEPASASATASTSAATAATGSDGGIPAVGDRRSHLRPRSDHDTLSATACQKCHGDQHAWWYGDAHYASIEPFLEGAPEPTRIARLYGISPAVMTRGDSLCMDCHGTVASARRGRAVQDGVSCQSCHGAAADYLEPHQEGDASLGRQRPGLKKGLALGMSDLEDLDVRLRNCASCHYVTDPRLISAGHPAGADFDIAERMARIRHWKEPVEPASAITPRWASILAERGPVPDVRRARLARQSSGGVRGSGASDAGARTGSGSAPARPPALRPRPAAVRSRPSGPQDGTVGGDGAAASAGADGPAVGERGLPVLDDTPIDDVLLSLQRELEDLYRRAGGGG